MADTLDRIKKLLALSASPNIEEARSASHKAAKLILEHQVVLRMPIGGFEDGLLSSVFTNMANEVRRQTQYDIQYEESIRQEVERRREADARGVQAQYERNSKPAPGSTPETSAHVRNPRASGRKKADPPSWHKTVATRITTCGLCEQLIKSQDAMFYRKGDRPRHPICHALEL